MSGQRLLQCAFPLIKVHGFTRKALALSALSLPIPHVEPLSDTAVTALFGHGDDARRTLLSAWLEEGRHDMERDKETTVDSLLKSRLRWNEPVLQFLPEAFALMVSPKSGILPLDPLPALRHVTSIADQACYLSGDQSTGNEWYARRASLAAVYTAAELHQLASPSTAESFLDELLDSTRSLGSAIADTAQFAQFVGRGWLGIIRSAGLS